MSPNLFFGFPRMQKERGERRDFCPSFVSSLADYGAHVIIESGYGQGLGFIESDYTRLSPKIRCGSHAEVYQQDYILVLRYPNEDEIRLMKPGACLISMVHYPTRTKRVANLRTLGIEAISLDSLKDDSGKRLVENLRAVAWNGVEVGIEVLSKIYPPPGFTHPGREPIRVTLLGSGGVAGYVIHAATRYGNEAFHQALVAEGCPGVMVTVVDYDITGMPEIMKELLQETDLLIDATQRRDSSKPIISNDWISWMPVHAVLVDLAVDPYDMTTDPLSVKGIEGIPGGNLDHYIFLPSDPAYQTVPKEVPTSNQRHVVSCYSWPGIHPKECMELYGSQLLPLIQLLIEKNGVQNTNPNGSREERAIARALLSRYPT